MVDFFVGLDLGQKRDFTAVAVVERQHGETIGYHLRYLERMALGTSFVDVVARVKSLLAVAPLYNRTALVLDATGVGLPVLDQFRRDGTSPIAISITGNTSASRVGSFFHVPKRELVRSLMGLLESRRFKWS